MCRRGGGAWKVCRPIRLGGTRLVERAEKTSTSSATAREAARKSGANAAISFRRLLAEPLRKGSVVPSSAALCRRIAALVEVRPLDEAAVELGVATGVVSRAVLEARVPPERLPVGIVRHALPSVDVLRGDAIDLGRALLECRHRRFGAAICGMPLVLLPATEKKRFVDAQDAVAPGRGFLLYTHCLTLPLPPYRKLGLAARREAWTPWSLPPASVWRYGRNDAEIHSRGQFMLATAFLVNISFRILLEVSKPV